MTSENDSTEKQWSVKLQKESIAIKLDVWSAKKKLIVISLKHMSPSSIQERINRMKLRTISNAFIVFENYWPSQTALCLQ